MQFWIKSSSYYLRVCKHFGLAAPSQSIFMEIGFLKSFDIIEPGKTTEQQVLEQLGKPVITQDYGSKSWIYVESKSQKTVLSGKKFINRKIVRISFTKKV